MDKEKYLRLGELLVKEGLISAAQLEKVIGIQRQNGGRLGEIVVKLKMVSEEQMVSLLGKQLGIPYFSLGTGMLKPAADQHLDDLIQSDFAYKNAVLPLSRTLRSLTVAMADPLDLILVDNLKKLTACEINPVIATRSDIMKAVEEFYRKTEMLKEAVDASYDLLSTLAEDIRVESAGDVDELSLDKLIARAEEAPVVKLVDLIIRQAIDERASDIHIEPFKDRISLRYRIDGKLYAIPSPSRHLHLPISSRIKILSKLDIAEKRLPQDGAFLVTMDDRSIDLRVSTIPTIYGEKVVIRILDRSVVISELDRMGFDSAQIELIRKVISAAYGLILITGPTGCGKSTTLYAIINELKRPDVNIVTVEDPVEYKMDGISQVQVRSEIGLTFATALRSFLRQDPDIMLVGEIRDLETAQTCIRSALTGHLILTTLHTNDAPSAISRLIDIGVEPYLLSSTISLIMSQRLVRKLCPDCKEAYEPSPEQFKGAKLKSELIYKAKGCVKCGQIGYKGRTCICEILFITPQIRDLISQGVSYQQIREAAINNGMQILFNSGIKKVEEGITSIEEVFSVTLSVDNLY